MSAWLGVIEDRVGREEDGKKRGIVGPPKCSEVAPPIYTHRTVHKNSNNDNINNEDIHMHIICISLTGSSQSQLDATTDFRPIRVNNRQDFSVLHVQSSSTNHLHNEQKKNI